MSLPKWMTTVTPLSKALALIIFTSFPIIGFFLGIRYQKLVYLSESSITPSISSTLVSPDNKVVSSYTSILGKIKITSPKPFYVNETIKDQGSWKQGNIVIKTRINQEDISALVIQYGIPSINGKGGACLDQNGNGAWQKKTILGQTVSSVCEGNLYLSAGYPKNPNGKVEYWFTVVKAKNASEFQLYKDIVYSGLSFTN
ncbi:MAG: hypothetical protein WC741_05095 [Patescibacteria group bacterium]|jgi:hypothetical protein